MNNYFVENAQPKTKRVFFTGTGALVKGQGLCYDSNRGTAANDDKSRLSYVELPTTSNNNRFAGTTLDAYAANANGQFVEIAEPGGIGYIALGPTDTTVDSTILTCSCSTADAGRFTQAGCMGRGTARALQTVAIGLTGETDGTGSLAADGVTLTGTGFTSAMVGYNVYLYVAHNTATDVLVPAKYTIASYTSATEVVLSAAANTNQAGALSCNYYVVNPDAEPNALAYLYDGDESGLQEWVGPKDNAAADCMDSGFTHILGGVTVASGDSTATLGNGTYSGQQKGFKLWGALTTNDYLVTVTNGIQADGSTALATLEFDGSGDTAYLLWGTSKWCAVEITGVAQA